MNKLTFAAAKQDSGQRLDRFLVAQMPETSRARIQDWIASGRVLLDGAEVKASLKLRGCERIEVRPASPAPLRAQAEDLPLDILYEDDDLAVVNKAAGVTVHAGAGRSEGTLVNALLHHFDQLSQAGGELRPGIVHRLDRFTSGALVVAKHDRAHQALAKQFQSRTIRKIYWALVHGDPTRHRSMGRVIEAGGRRWVRLEMAISRDRRSRVRMAARGPGRTAQTDFRVLKQNSEYSLLEVRIATGRTHQIRVHLSAIGHPVVGDRLYGAAKAPAGLPPLERFYLHAREIGFEHPSTGEPLRMTAPLPAEFTELLRALAL